MKLETDHCVDSFEYVENAYPGLVAVDGNGKTLDSNLDFSKLSRVLFKEDCTADFGKAKWNAEGCAQWGKLHH